MMDDCICPKQAGLIESCLQCREPCDPQCRTEHLKHRLWMGTIEHLPLILAFLVGLLTCLLVSSILLHRL